MDRTAKPIFPQPLKANQIYTMTKHLFAAIIIAALSTFHTMSANQSIRSRHDALRDSILSRVSGATVSDRVVSITRFGAKGDGVTDCHPAFEKAMRKADRTPGGIKITVPAGTYFISGPITLTNLSLIHI